MTGSLDDMYLEYLYDLVGLPRRGRNRTYYKLFRQMYSKEFVWLLNKDASRAEDGREIRWEFVKAAGLSKVQARWLYEPCTVLEMLVGAARRLASLTEGEVKAWFIQLLYNTELDTYTDSSFDGYIQTIDNKLEMLVWRTYLSNGKGGLFPLDNPPNDQRTLEIWNQMNLWLIEKQYG